MGKGSKSKKPRRKMTPQGRVQAQPGQIAALPPEGRQSAIRPPPERAQHGKVTIPTGPGRQEAPAMTIHDAVARLYDLGQINYAQEQAARHIQEAHAAFRAELGLSTGRSCLDIGPVGHDEGDGNVEAYLAYRRITERLTTWQRGAIEWTVCSGKTPGNLPLLRGALDVVAGA